MLFPSCFVMLSCTSVCWCPVVTCWEMADLFALVCDVYNCDVVTFPLVSWVRCGAWLYRILIFALFLTSNSTKHALSWPASLMSASENKRNWPQSLKQFFINVSNHILVASLTLMARAIRVRLATSIWFDTSVKNCFKDWSQSKNEP